MEQISSTADHKWSYSQNAIWWSICSIHKIYNKNCHICQVGKWIPKGMENDPAFAFNPRKFEHRDGSPANPFPNMR
jgi:hypothetical protein